VLLCLRPVLGHELLSLSVDHELLSQLAWLLVFVCHELDLIYARLTGDLMTLTLTHGPVSLATMVSEPGLHLLAVGSGRARNGYLFLYWLLMLTREHVTILFGMKLASLNY
jgi:hypothetical protein